MVGWREALPSSSELPGLSVRETNVPVYDAEAVGRCLDLCRENLCGKYGACWACPPGHSDHMDVLGPLYSGALLVSMVHEGDPKDETLVEEANTRLKKSVRRMVSALRSAGFECRGLCDGGCDICQKCSYPKPCRHPDMVLPSVSAVGIDMERYLESVGEKLEFRNDRVTFYAIILFHDPE